MKRYPSIMCMITMILLATLLYAAEHNFSQYEETGIDPPQYARAPIVTWYPDNERPIICLLIPDSDNDKIGMFDPYSGAYFGDFIIDDTSSNPVYDFQTPINAIQGPDYNIYVSDQVSNAVYVFDHGYGTYLHTYIDSTDGLNNIRGIAFRDDHLFVTCGDHCVAEFDGPHSFVRNFIDDGSDPFDIQFLEDGRALVSDIQGTNDNVRLYDSSGTLQQVLFITDTPEQLQEDVAHPDTFLVSAFLDSVVAQFTTDGTILYTTPCVTPRGVYRLGNDNYLITNGSGVFEIDPINGNIIEQEYSFSARFMELVVLSVGISEYEYKSSDLSISVNPNPFAQRIWISLALDCPECVHGYIYSLEGQRIKELIHTTTPAQHYHFSWDGRDDNGFKMSNGIYFIRIYTSRQAVVTKKVILMK